MTEITPFERDIAEQPEALRRLADSPMNDLTAVVGGDWDRVVFTGMGSSHFAGIPSSRALTAMGYPTWAVDTGQLLDTPGLLTPRTLVVATSQSGASGEIVELLNRRTAGELSVGTLVGIADDEGSPLAQLADTFLPLKSGPEATVSTKSYLNTLAVHAALVGAFRSTPSDVLRQAVLATALTVEQMITAVDLDDVAGATSRHRTRRLAYIGRGDEAATALFAALITKESSKVPAEGFVGGEFRHGPFELAGDGLTAVVFAQRASDPGGNVRRLIEELIAAGSRVVFVGDDEVPGALEVPNRGRSTLEALAIGSVVAERFAVPLARANGFVPGAFLYGSKVTTVL